MPLPAQLVFPTGSPGSLAASGSAPAPLAPTGPGSGSGAGTEAAPVLSGGRGRRRALLRGDTAGPGLSERPVLLEWFSAPADELPRRLAEAQRRTGLCHINLLRVLQAGPLGPRSGYVISEAPAGVDLLSVLRAARPRGVPTWWLVAVAAGVGRGLQALSAHAGPGAEPHSGLSPAAIFVGWQGEVQLLAFSALVEEGSGLRREAPELRLGAHLFGPAADVYALARLLLDLLPAEPRDSGGADAEAPLRALLAQAQAPDPAQRPDLRALCAGLNDYLHQAGPPALAQAVGGILQELHPRETASDQSSGEVDLTPLQLPQPAHDRDPDLPTAAAAVTDAAQGDRILRTSAGQRAGDARARGASRAPAGIPWPYWLLAGLLALAGALVPLLLG